MSSDRYIRRILEHLADRRYQPVRPQVLAQELHVPVEELEDFAKAVNRLLEEGQLVRGASDTIALPPPGREMVGTFRRHFRGFGFIVPDSPVEHGDLFVPAAYTMGAMTGDRVRAQVLYQRERAERVGRSPYIGKVVEILQRAQNRFVGNLRKLGSQWVVDVDGQVLSEPVIVRDASVKGARAGDKVVLELIQYPQEGRPGQGVILEVLGEQGQPDVETLGVMRAYGLPESFPLEVLEEAGRVAREFDESKLEPDREDLRDLLTLTIDPPDAKDYDDAISLRRLGEKGAEVPGWLEGSGAVWELGVHIADVSYFVQAGSVVDQEARRRGNSTYLPRRVIPMLPEVLSNGVCSLQEGVTRYCLTALIYLDEGAQVVGQRFCRSAIRSSKRLTYLEAQALIDGDLKEAVRHAQSEPRYPRELIQSLRDMEQLARRIRQRRLEQGMIVLDLPEVELIFDETGRVVDAQPEDDAFTHTLIEMFMVEANEAVARLFAGLGIPMIRRIHPEPPVHDMEELQQFARAAGLVVGTHPGREELQRLLAAVEEHPAKRAIHLAVLKTLARAEYSPENIGHYALASEHYTHFTSPIRRYPDLVVHRGLGALLDYLGDLRWRVDHEKHGSYSLASLRRRWANRQRDWRKDPRLPSEEELVQISRHCSATERNSEAAEDDLRTYLVLDLLREHLGEDYEGTVTGITSEGVFVQLDKFLVDGFVKLADLPGQPWDRWRLNRQSGVLVAGRSGKSIRIGDRFVVRIANVNPVRRSLEMVIVSQVGQAPRMRRKTLPSGLRKIREEARRLKRDRRAQRRKRRG